MSKSTQSPDAAVRPATTVIAPPYPSASATVPGIDTYARSAFEDTRRKAAKFGAMGSTIRATKRG